MAGSDRKILHMKALKMDERKQIREKHLKVYKDIKYVIKKS